MNHITAIVLASGLSRRMGTNKLLLKDMDGEPIITHILRLIQPFAFKEVLVVTGYEAIASMAKDFGYRPVYNDAPEMGQSRSVVLGVSASENADGWLFFNGDMPCLNAETIEGILAAVEASASGMDNYKCFSLRREASPKIIVPRYDGVPGQPVYFPTAFESELLMLTGDTGGRQIIRKYPESVYYLDIDDGRQGMDIDTPQDYVLYKNSESIRGGNANE